MSETLFSICLEFLTLNKVNKLSDSSCLVSINRTVERLSGLVVRAPGYRSRGPESEF
jgi:hypothetical protein